MKNLILLMSLFLISLEAWAVCSAPISRTNNTTGQVLTSTKYNLDLNTVYSKVNALPGDCIDDSSIATAKLASASVTTAKLAAEVTAKFMPAGAILPFGGSIAPAGYLLCDGSAVSRTTYADLFAVVGTSFGSGNGSTTFTLPDFRGRFLRGVDGGAGRDEDRATRTAMSAGGGAGDSIGSIQPDSFASHVHTYATAAGASFNGLNNFPTFAGGGNSFSNSTPATGGSETRPENANVQYIIKF